MAGVVGKKALLTAGLLMAGVVMASDKPLLTAVKDGELGRVQQLISEGADVNVRTLDGSSALLLATRANQIDIAQALIAAGASLRFRRSMTGARTPRSRAMCARLRSSVTLST